MKPQLRYKFYSPSNLQQTDIKVHIFRNRENKSEFTFVIRPCFVVETTEGSCLQSLHSNLVALGNVRSRAFTHAVYTIFYGLKRKKQFFIQDALLALCATFNI